MTNPHVQNPYTQQSPQSPFPPPNILQVAAPPMPHGQQYGPPPQEHPQGTLILIFGIVGIFISLFAAIAWYLGANAMKEIRATGIRYSNESNIDTGRLLGKIVTIIAFVGLAIVFLIWFVFGVLLVGARLSQGL
jgi:hypothetical protein